jgi:uncharacterized membrane protein
MDISRLGLTETESRILKGCGNSELTRRRMRQVVVAAAAFAILLVAMGWYSRSLAFVLVVALVYIGVTTWEKLSYGRGVLAYKSIITKLVRRLNELDTGRAR